MRQILIIDDDKHFDEVEGEQHVYARTEEEGLSLLPTAAWDEVWLDYCLDGRKTIEGIIAYLLEQAVTCPLPIAAIKPVSSSRTGQQVVTLLLGELYEVIS